MQEKISSEKAALTNNELLERVANRDSQALSVLYDRYAAMLYSLIYKIVGKKDLAEEVLQEVFIQIRGKAGMFNGQKGSVSTWFMTMARNLSMDMLRSKAFANMSKNNPIETEEYNDRLMDHKTPLDSVLISEKQTFIREALTRLTPEQRLSLEMAYFGGFTQTEIAARLKVPLGTVKTRMRQGMISLRNMIEKKYGKIIS